MHRKAVGTSTKVVSRVAWGAVLAGLFVATTAFMVLGSVATAVSLSFGTQAPFEMPLWISSVAMLAMFFGGLTASYLSAGEGLIEAALHGVVLWGATALVLLFFALNGISLYGAEMMVGQPEQIFGRLSPQDAWWAFVGVMGTLSACTVGSLTGVLRTKLGFSGLRFRRRQLALKPS